MTRSPRRNAGATKASVDDAKVSASPTLNASGSEWRTAPLWGIGLLKTVNGHVSLLHDGRARSVEEAILWHGGEARPVTDAFMALPAEQRAAVLRFVESR